MKIVFFNHYHRGDLFTHKEFVRHIKKLLPDNTYEYWHYNHPKVNLDLQIPLTNTPHQIDHKIIFCHINTNETLGINTWIGAWSDILSTYKGVNLQSLYDSWKIIFDKLGLKLHDDPEEYLPSIDYRFFNVKNVDEYLSKSNRKKVLICNGKPMSNQSFESDMQEIICSMAAKYENIDFICTKKIEQRYQNIHFTDDVIKDNDQFRGVNPFWNDRPQNTCDLNEISYLSTKCDVIIGKNSGPFVFCETKENFKDPKKIMVSFSNGPEESMSNKVDVKCDYRLITNHVESNVYNTINSIMARL